MTNEDEGVEKNIPEAPVISFIGLDPILSFSGRPCEFGVGLPDPDKSELPLRPSSIASKNVPCLIRTDLLVVPCEVLTVVRLEVMTVLGLDWS